jgi:hypothetical protein
MSQRTKQEWIDKDFVDNIDAKIEQCCSDQGTKKRVVG